MGNINNKRHLLLVDMYKLINYLLFLLIVSIYAKPSFPQKRIKKLKKRYEKTGEFRFKFGDVILPTEYYNFMMSDTESPEGRGVLKTVPLWHNWVENGYYIIPYYITNTYHATAQQKLRGLLAEANREFKQKTNIEIREVDPNYCNKCGGKMIKITNGPGCFSYLGRIDYPGYERQELSLNYQSNGADCFYRDTVLHEFMHALGFIHEQNRPDRDDYIRVNWGNIYSGMEDQFQKVQRHEVELSGTQYDYASVMQYHETAFSRDWRSKVMEAKNGATLGSENKGLSHYDVIELNAVYPGRKDGGQKTTTKPKTTPTTTPTTKPTTKPPSPDSNCLSKSDPRGFNYQGNTAVTGKGRRCQRWDRNYPNKINYRPSGRIDHNYCRNPDNDENGPWCYLADYKSSDGTRNYQYCDIPSCQPLDCLPSSDPNGFQYRGDFDTTRKGRRCQRWNTNKPNRVDPFDNFVTDMRGDNSHNHCRNPDND